MNQKSVSSHSANNLRTGIILLAVLLLGFGIAAAIYNTAPKPKRGESKTPVRLVEVTELKKQTLRPQWISGGEISAAQRVKLSAQVAGRVAQVVAKAVPGATFSKGELIASIEKQDFLLQFQQKQAMVIQAQATLDLEMGQAQVAKEDYERAKSRLNSGLESNDLLLRKPQIASAKAGLQTAQANLALAQLALDRTDIRMPFNGQIISRSINTGSQVNSNSELFDLVATDEFWLQVKVPQSFLEILDTDQAVVIKSGQYQREADILHSLGDVDAIDRQAKILISIKKPEQAALLIGGYIDCILYAKEIPNTYVINNKYLKDDGGIWVVNNNKLFKRVPSIRYQSRDQSWIESGFMDGDQLLNSNLGVVTQGTPVRVAQSRQQDLL